MWPRALSSTRLPARRSQEGKKTEAPASLGSQRTQSSPPLRCQRCSPALPPHKGSAQPKKGSPSSIGLFSAGAAHQTLGQPPPKSGMSPGSRRWASKRNQRLPFPPTTPPTTAVAATMTGLANARVSSGDDPRRPYANTDVRRSPAGRPRVPPPDPARVFIGPVVLPNPPLLPHFHLPPALGGAPPGNCCNEGGRDHHFAEGL